ncbi:MAG: CAP domain-containing protein [Draconibacterium sp.]|nr:CAP domain-containing protein [Draconibacterium sp.]
MKNLVTVILISVYFLGFATDPKTANNLNTAENVSYLSPIEKEIIYEINLFRSNPADYADKYIAPLAKNYKGKLLYYPNDKPLLTKEGVRAVNECVRELKKVAPLSVVSPSSGLTKAADDHVKDQSKTGKTGHYGSDRSDSRKRMERYGDWKVRIAENIAYGGTSARQVIIYLLIDDGVQDRGHRKNFIQPEFKNVGVSVGFHPEYNTMCVMDFAGFFVDK